MISIDNFLNHNNSIEDAPSKTLWAIFRYLHDNPKERFKDQKTMLTEISNTVTPNNPLSQAALSKTLKMLTKERLLLGNYLYTFDKRDGFYGLYSIESGLRELFRLGDIYEKRKVFVASDNMLVFNLQPGMADIFATTLKNSLDESIFFGITTHNDQMVFLLFDMSHPRAEEMYAKFKNFFRGLFDFMLGLTNDSEFDYLLEKKEKTDDR